MIFGPDTHIKKMFETCSTAINRLKEGPLTKEDVQNEIEKSENWEWTGYKYSDYSFSGLFDSESSWWFMFQPLSKIWDYEWDKFTQTSKFKRLSSEYPDSELYYSNRNLNNLNWWREVSQGHLGDCTFIASMNSIGKKP